MFYKASFAVKSCFDTFPSWVGWGRVRSDGVDSDNRATKAQVQMNLPTRAELGNRVVKQKYVGNKHELE